MELTKSSKVVKTKPAKPLKKATSRSFKWPSRPTLKKDWIVMEVGKGRQPQPRQAIPTKLQPLVPRNDLLDAFVKKDWAVIKDIKQELIEAAEESALCEKEAVRAGLQTIVHLPHGLNLVKIYGTTGEFDPVDIVEANRLSLKLARAFLKYESIGEKLFDYPNIDYHWARLQMTRGLTTASMRHGLYVPPPD
ncbi:hypothetical protein HDU76_005360, partial [Blyttiomyces sp. JEL0837]